MPAGVSGITGVTGPQVEAGHAYFQGTLTSAPDSTAAYSTIDRVRTAVHAVPGAAALVGGTTAVTLDIANAADHDRNLIIPLILLLVFVILALLLRTTRSRCSFLASWSPLASTTTSS